MTEKELTDLLNSKEPHDLYTCPTEDAQVEFDDEDIHDLLVRTHLVLRQVLERRLPKELDRDVRELVTDVEAGLAWYRQF